MILIISKLFYFCFLEDSGLNSVATPVLNPIRVRFARSETEWQRKRREQSFQVDFIPNFKVNCLLL